MTISKPSKSHSTGNASTEMSGQPLLWLNVVCLDAPLVALSWQLFLAAAFHLAPRPGESAALFLTAWWIYLVDRFADSISLSPGTPRAVRADFCLRHKHAWAAMLLMVGLLDAAIIVRSLGHEIIVHGMVLGVVALVYLAINYAASKLWQVIPLKEMTVGFLFAAGTVMALLPRAGSNQSSLLVLAFFFGCLCSLNCLSIAVWERELDASQGKHSFARGRPTAAFSVRVLCLLLVITCWLIPLTVRGSWSVTAGVALSGLLLLALHFSSFVRDERTALADLVLLTPLLFLAGEKFL